MKNRVFAALAAASSLAFVTPVSAAVIDLSGVNGIVTGPIVTPEATFTSSTGSFSMDNGGLTDSLCTVASFSCAGTLSIAFNGGINGLTFQAGGFNSDMSLIHIAGLADGGAFTADFQPGAIQGFLINLAVYQNITSLTVTNDDAFGLAFANFRYTTLTPPVSGAVPEPASWALMIGGFGLMGATLRRNRSTRTSVRFA